MSQAFFDLILPQAGRRFIGHHSGGKFSPSFLPNNQLAASKAAALDNRGKGEVYFGCAAYADPKLGRKGQNVLAVRSCYLDIDTRESKPDAPYADKLEAKIALAKFCCELDLPSPTLVDSGNGLHVYWPLEKDLAPDEWRQLANLLKWSTHKAGLQVDPSRTMDIASVLRVPGTTNRKDPANPRPVQLIYLSEPILYARMWATLLDYAGAEAVAGQSVVSGHGLQSNLKVHKDFPPSDAHLIAEQCAVIRHIRDTRGNVSEPLWFAGLGVLAHTVQGDQICHECSRGHPEYDPAETQAKIDRLKAYGPTTCERLNAVSEGLCNGCPHREGA